MARLLVVLFLIVAKWASAQNTYAVSGRIFSGKETLPFATILVKNENKGTNSNNEGHFNLKLPEGTHEIVFQYIGYAPRTEKINVQQNMTLDIELKPEGISLKEVSITVGEDPAVAIIRHAIKKRKFHLNEVDAFSCQAYIKALQKIESMPKNIKGLLKLFGGEVSDTNDIKGILYLSESESHYYFQRPDKEKEIMYSSKISGNNQSFSFNKLSDIQFNLYNNLLSMGNLSNRPFISPLNDNAFLFYRYYLQGSTEQDGKTIHKIKVVPKKKTDACFSGIIYIVDGKWNVAGVDFLLTKETKINFVDTLAIKQLYAPVINETWMPVSLNFSFDFSVFGFVGTGYFNAHISNYNLNPGFPSGFFSNEQLIVQEGSNKKDSLYWETHRAVPLTQEEKSDYHEKDSITKIRDTDHYKDSADKVANKLKFRDILLGYQYQKTKKDLTVSLPGILTAGVQYNTVEGPNISYQFSILKNKFDEPSRILAGKVRYGFTNYLWGGELAYTSFFDPVKRSSFSIRLKSITEQFNQAEPITPLVNSIYSLFLNENYMKLYRESAAEGTYSTELVNGLYLNTGMQYALREPLKNTSDWLIINDPEKRFTTNNPQNSFTEDSAFIPHSALIASVQFNIRLKQKYSTLPHKKVVEGSRYPRISVGYRKGISLSATSANFDLITASVADGVRAGIFGRFNYRVTGGGFLTNKKLYFMDYRHFMGNQTIIQTNEPLGSYRLLPYYRYSADKWFAEAHIEHHFQGLILGQLPLLRRLKCQEVAGAHFLKNNQLNEYFEFNFGLERLFQIIRVDYVMAIQPDNPIRHGFTVGLMTRF